MSLPFGLLLGLIAVAFVKGLAWTEHRFESMRGNDYTRHLTGMLVVGGMAMRTMKTAGVGCALVFSRPGSSRAADLVGVLTARELSADRLERSEIF